ncbi:Stp1/IreP family PP2C-type Ser/Thr phosphatase [Ruicaihuangia caeni]|uniref:Stp1/IreP family PP2C-type Ser/Thr phosphatase n=1 Tax=Ruicaihuangia caeni TaxID=3042517 RepID=A0AAW6TAS3_9MICO|nr:Stp1/IreP family PP2C-type Ser/Thr phosphatase [Klugiella sp. YN-L-19]MDI2099160.1 Stp1/IreP family PP2C-type Ser/Thr phosphatase [Klugiella sp. YN-L-19]
MVVISKSAALSHVGKIRANNQDSGYAGTHLFMVADGMGGHAGGDVASAIALQHIIQVDREFDSAQDAEAALHKALSDANVKLAETVYDHPELTGMGTTVSAVLRVGREVAIAHIGDSRIYLFRDGELSQITVDHTFVQRLVDSGRITQEEAAVHPRRSVLMRVLGDVDATPDIDTMVLTTLPGDRWMICSDGLSSYVSEEKILATLANVPQARDAASRLVRESLDNGAPDNVTVVVVNIDGSDDSASQPPSIVGSAALPLTYEGEINRAAPRLPTLLLHPLKATKPDPTHFEPESEEYLDELIDEDRRRARRRRVTWLTMVLLAIAAIVTGIALAYNWTQSQYYVGAAEGRVAIFQGVQQGVGPISLSHVYEPTEIWLDDLPYYTRTSVEATINARNLDDARAIIERIDNAAQR